MCLNAETPNFSNNLFYSKTFLFVHNLFVQSQCKFEPCFPLLSLSLLSHIRHLFSSLRPLLSSLRPLLSSLRPLLSSLRPLLSPVGGHGAASASHWLRC